MKLPSRFEMPESNGNRSGLRGRLPAACTPTPMAGRIQTDSHERRPSRTDHQAPRRNPRRATTSARAPGAGTAAAGGDRRAAARTLRRTLAALRAGRPDPREERKGRRERADADVRDPSRRAAVCRILSLDAVCAPGALILSAGIVRNSTFFLPAFTMTTDNRSLRDLLIRNFDDVRKERRVRGPLYESQRARLAVGTAAKKLGAAIDILAPGMR